MVKTNVAVLMGGASAERDISLSTGRQIAGALDPAKYNVYAIDTSPQPALPPGLPDYVLPLRLEGGQPETSLTRLPMVSAPTRPDVVVIALHGKGGEDGQVQGFLESLGIPYTGSGILASALAMDKARCKIFLEAVGVRMPAGIVLRRGEPIPDTISLPCVIKPVAQGSSDGVTIIGPSKDIPLRFEGGRGEDRLVAAIELAWKYDDAVLVEEFIQGVEITCAVLGNERLEPLPLVEIVPAKGVYDREAKYTPGATDEICPARLPAAVAEEAKAVATLCHRALGCRGMSRTDMIVTPDGEIFTLEVNTIPGMTPTSLLPRAAGAAGYTFSELLDKLIGFALER